MNYAYQFIHRVIQKFANEIIPSARFPFNEFGFGGGKPPAIPPPPAIAPAPVPVESTPGATLEGRQRQIAMLKYGALSTITNQYGASGISGAGPDLYPSMSGGKQTVGQ